jgi:hypothetical protein
MEKVIRVCEITGKVTTIATGLTAEQAKALIKEKARNDEFGQYLRIAPNPQDLIYQKTCEKLMQNA